MAVGGKTLRKELNLAFPKGQETIVISVLPRTHYARVTPNGLVPISDGTKSFIRLFRTRQPDKSYQLSCDSKILDDLSKVTDLKKKTLELIQEHYQTVVHYVIATERGGDLGIVLLGFLHNPHRKTSVKDDVSKALPD